MREIWSDVWREFRRELMLSDSEIEFMVVLAQIMSRPIGYGTALKGRGYAVLLGCGKLGCDRGLANSESFPHGHYL